MPVTIQHRETAQAADRTISRNVHAPYAARRFARTQLLAWHLPGLLDAAELVVSELASNASQHGAGLAIKVRLVFSGGLLTINVWDGDSANFPVMTVADPLEESGRGLALVDALSESWGSHPAKPAGKVVWARLKASAGDAS